MKKQKICISTKILSIFLLLSTSQTVFSMNKKEILKKIIYAGGGAAAFWITQKVFDNDKDKQKQEECEKHKKIEKKLQEKELEISSLKKELESKRTLLLNLEEFLAYIFSHKKKENPMVASGKYDVLKLMNIHDNKYLGKDYFLLNFWNQIPTEDIYNKKDFKTIATDLAKRLENKPQKLNVNKKTHKKSKKHKRRNSF